MDIATRAPLPIPAVSRAPLPIPAATRAAATWMVANAPTAHTWMAADAKRATHIPTVVYVAVDVEADVAAVVAAAMVVDDTDQLDRCLVQFSFVSLHFVYIYKN